MAQAWPSPTIDCTPDGTINKYPCIHCLSETQLLSMLAVILYALNHTGDTTLTNMVEDGACFRCLSDKQILEAVVAVWLALAIQQGYFTDASDAIDKSKCLNCADLGTVKGIIAKGFCEFVKAS